MRRVLAMALLVMAGSLNAQPPPGLSGCTARLVAEQPGSRINVRDGPGLEFGVAFQGRIGDRAAVVRGPVDGFSIREDGDGKQWVEVQFPGSGKRGWVRRDFLSKFTC
ncbi:MAG TPA: SH3 domain-containing protein [Pelomicrobium sp.]|nr:SH3 domain-containing protein [Pelomicrobium sp.]